MECWFDLERHLDAEIIGLRVGVHEIGPVLKKIVTNSRTGKTRKLSREGGTGISSSILVFLSTIPTYKNLSSFYFLFFSL